MTTETAEIIDYPIKRYDDLTIDPVYLDLQQRGPVRIQLPYGEPCWVATRYEDVKTVYGDRRFGKEIGIGKDTPRMWPMSIDDPTLIANMDPPKHTRIRRLTKNAFSVPRIRSLRGWAEAKIDRLLDEMAARGTSVDFIDTVSWNFPLQIISGILGVTEDDIPTFRGWVDQLTGGDSEMSVRMEAHHHMTEYIRSLIAARRVEATDDLLSELVHARDEEDRLTEDELVSLSLTLFLGGFETTASQIGSSVWTLMSYRHLWEELLDDRELLPAALEELWRWIPTFRHGVPMIRWANEDVELSNGVVIPGGQAVLAEHQVANRDETVFPRASEVDFHRDDPAPHLSLAWGVHRCMGAHLAHLEIEVAILALLERFPTLQLAVPAEDVPWSSVTFLRGPAELPLTW